MDYTNSRMKALISDHIHSLRDRRILHRRLIDGLTFDALAEEFELSERQIKNIVYKNEMILFKHIPD